MVTATKRGLNMAKKATQHGGQAAPTDPMHQLHLDLQRIESQIGTAKGSVDDLKGVISWTARLGIPIIASYTLALGFALWSFHASFVSVETSVRGLDNLESRVGESEKALSAIQARIAATEANSSESRYSGPTGYLSIYSAEGPCGSCVQVNLAHVKLNRHWSYRVPAPQDVTFKNPADAMRDRLARAQSVVEGIKERHPNLLVKTKSGIPASMNPDFFYELSDVTPDLIADLRSTLGDSPFEEFSFVPIHTAEEARLTMLTHGDCSGPCATPVPVPRDAPASANLDGDQPTLAQ